MKNIITDLASNIIDSGRDSDHVRLATIKAVDRSSSTWFYTITIGPTDITKVVALESYVNAQIGDVVNVLQLAQGNLIILGRVASPRWNTYTPVWTTTGTAPAIGNGTINGRFNRRGQTCDFNIFFIAGTTTTFGTGDFQFTLPFAADAPGASYEIWVPAHGFLPGANRVGLARLFGTKVLQIYGDTAPGVAWNATTPGTFGSGNSISINGTYEVSAGL